MIDDIGLYLARFLCGSTLLLATVWLIERAGVIKNLQLRSWLWKLAIIGSLILLIPISTAIFPDNRWQITLPTAEPQPRSTADRETITQSAEFENFGIDADAANPLVESSEPAVGNGTSASETTFPLLEFISNPIALAFLAWLLISGVALLRMGIGYYRGIRSLGHRQTIASDSHLYQLYWSICSNAGINRPPALTRTSRTATPITLLNNEICLPDWADESLSRGELSSLLAHELGHVKNRDLSYLLFSQIVCRLFFFQPLFFLARNRLVDLSEFLADQWALQHCQNRDDVANALLNCASKVRQQHTMQWGLAMTGRTSRLRSRIEAILRTSTQAIANLGPMRKIAVAVGVLAVVMLLPKFEYSYADTDEEPATTKTAMALEEKQQQLQQVLAEAAKHQHELERRRAQLAKEQQQAMQEVQTRQELLKEEEQKIAAKGQALEQLQMKVQHLNEQLAVSQLDANQEELQQKQAALQEQISALVEKRTALANEPEAKVAEIEKAQQVLEQQFYNATEQSEATIQALQQELAILAKDDSTAMYVRSTNGKSHAKWRYNGRVEEVFWHGDIGVDDEETKITSLERGGYFEYNSRGFTPDRAITFKRTGGDISIDYTKDGQPATFTDADKEWFQQVLVRFFRNTGAGAEKRVERLLRRGGADLVVDEMHYIESDSVYRKYSTALVEQTSLTDNQFTRLMKTTNTVSSDSEMRRLLLVVLEHGDVAGQRWDSLLPATLTISSDSEMRRLLTTVSTSKPKLNAEQWQFFFNAAATISSDSEARRLLVNVVDDTKALTTNHRELFKVAKDISSDSELRRLLSDNNLLSQLNETQWEAYFDVAATISSDSEMGRALSAAIDTGKLSNDAWALAFNLVDNAMSSSSEKGRVLRQAAKSLPDDRELQDLYNNTVKSISSKSTRESLSVL